MTRGDHQLRVVEISNRLAPRRRARTYASITVLMAFIINGVHYAGYGLYVDFPETFSVPACALTQETLYG